VVEERLLFKDLTEEQAAALRAYVDGPAAAWKEEEVLFLHALLLEDLERAASPQATLSEKLELLRWVFTDPDKEDVAFSFRNCLRVCCAAAGTMPSAHRGKLGADSMREALAAEMRPRLAATLSRLDGWIRQLVCEAPAAVGALLERNPKAFDAGQFAKVADDVKGLAAVAPAQALVWIEHHERNRDKTNPANPSKRGVQPPAQAGLFA